MIQRDPASRRNRRGFTFLIFVAFILLLVLRGLATFWTDLLWFRSVDLGAVWGTLILSKVIPAVIGSVVAFLMLWTNVLIADRLSPRFRLFDMAPEEEFVERIQEWIEPRIRKVRLWASAVFGVLVGISAAGWWDNILRYLNRSSFGQTDPILGKDVSFYVFQLPLYRDLFGWVFQLLLLTTLLVAGMHYLNGGIRLLPGRAPRVSAGVRAHLSVLLAAIAILKAIGYRLDTYELMYSSRGIVYGASFTDVKAQLPALALLSLISLFAAALLLWNIRSRGWTLPAVAVGGWLVMSIVVGGIIPAAVQRFRVEPAEQILEKPYIENGITFTRQAYGLDDVEVRQFAASPNLTLDDIENNRPTVDNIKLWDPAVLTDTYTQLQEIRTYYGLNDVDVDRYMIDGALTQTMIAARELDEEADVISGWVNEHLVYTHGFGAVLSPANTVDEQGQPVFLVQDVPPVATDPSLDITQPRIYFGDTYSDRFLIVGTKQKEVDFPLTQQGESVARNTYDGSGGVPIGSMFNRAAFALRYSDLNTLISNQLTADSKTLMIRNVSDRLRTAAPFLRVDSDPYLVDVGGRLIWIVDMYTVSDAYPYAQPASINRLGIGVGTLPNRFNYVRNTVKATVDAYDGTIRLYVVDDSDPIIRAYRAAFPSLFSDRSALPADLVAHLRYPEDLFRVQSDMYLRFHMTEPDVFYNSEDEWEEPLDPSNAGNQDKLRGEFLDPTFARPMLPYYLLMRLPEEQRLSYLILQPFLPVERPNMASFLIAKSGPEDYGKLIDYRLPRTGFVDGPNQVAARIDQNPQVSQQITLWNQQGSQVIRGDLLVVPIESSLLYIQPIYLQAAKVPLPQFKRVVAVFNEEVVMRETLAEALQDVFAGGATSTTPTGPTAGQTAPDLLDKAAEAFTQAETALRAGDLGTYQAKIEEAKTLIEQARKLLGG
ncbi:hypothetical protein BMS3Bbin01_02651 [bacterium BMS3Bbin01]|nr:hypothetical protein BMS3Bbin01_02651 [bacterium BMS3Bbin01]